MKNKFPIVIDCQRYIQEAEGTEAFNISSKLQIFI